MRIVSLLPAATEIVVALGLAGDLVGITHACRVPGGPGQAAVVTRRLPLRSRARGARHEHAEAIAHAGAAAFEVDLDAVAALEPDLMLLQERCPACGIRYRALGAAARSRLGRRTSVVSLEAASIDGILHAVATVGAMTAAEDEAVRLVELLRERLAAVEGTVGARRRAGHRPPRVVALDWVDPPVSVGHWVPEQVRRAGGWDLLGDEGGRARATTWAAVREVDPEMIVLMPCGLDLPGTLAAWERARRPSGWAEIRAVQRGQVVAVDADAYFSRPVPAAIDGIELLAEVFDPPSFVDMAPANGWMPVR